MKRFFTWLLLATTIFSLCGCAQRISVSETTTFPVETAVNEIQAVAPETEPTILEDSLFLKVSSITFSLVGGK